MISPLLPARLLLRAADDLHAIARAADDLAAIAEAARSLPRIEAALTERISELDARMAGLLELAERIERGLPALERLLATIDDLGTATATLATAVGPLQGVAERLGRIADRLPGSRAAGPAIPPRVT